MTAGPESSTVSHPEQQEISLLDILLVLAERRKLIFLITVIFAIGAIIISLVLPKRYTAETTILPPDAKSSSLSSMMTSQLGNLGGIAALAGGSLGLKNPNEMFIAMLKSQTVENAMVHRYNLMQEYHSKYLSLARKSFEKHVTLDGNGKDGLIHISVEDWDPKRAAELANGYVDQFRTLSQTLAITEAGQRRLFFEQQLQQSKDRLADAEEALKETEQKTGMIQLDSQARALIETAASLRAQVTAKEVQLQAMQTYATSENANVVEMQKELDGLRAQLAKLTGNQDETSGALIAPKGMMAQTGLEYVRRLRDVKYYETIFEILARQYELARLDEAKEGAVIQVVDPAIVPDRRSFPQRALITVVTTFIGFFFACSFALAQAGLAHMRQDPETNAKLSLLRQLLRFRRSPAIAHER
ncbi:chain length determinant family protein [Acidipila sp. 4G-K13]|uniref:Chain length determinant family protein n=2 Tax=Paracidobacterium acidisoli TaxID=2303751 RepID=A0A372IMY5_9BACT|nr:chain length determinant family protein [Paracidobacterium acidisoli]